MFDVIVVGGGPAGLQACLVFGRTYRNTLLIDDANPRNQYAHEVHTLLVRGCFVAQHADAEVSLATMLKIPVRTVDARQRTANAYSQGRSRTALQVHYRASDSGFRREHRRHKGTLDE